MCTTSPCASGLADACVAATAIVAAVAAASSMSRDPILIRCLPARACGGRARAISLLCPQSGLTLSGRSLRRRPRSWRDRTAGRARRARARGPSHRAPLALHRAPALPRHARVALVAQRLPVDRLERDEVLLELLAQTRHIPRHGLHAVAPVGHPAQRVVADSLALDQGVGAGVELLLDLVQLAQRADVAE